MAQFNSLRLFGFLGTALVVLVGVVAGAILYWRPDPTPPAPSTDDPRLSWPTPYRNVRPEVAYVGDAVCSNCHQQIAEKYAKHPMGRSMALMSHEAGHEKRGPENNNPFEKFDSRFKVFLRDGKTFHREERLDAKGNVATAVEGEIRYVIGSGTRGKSYLVEHEGRLFQSPISWFSEKQIWDVSPSFSEERHFTRMVNARCLFCHANYADAVADSVNQYREPVFRGLSIGCERCHGPGSLHVERHQTGAATSGLDDTIVNPKNLEPVLRESVCQQCHLQGEQRVLRRNRGVFDFRPGLPLYLFWAVCVRQPDFLESYRSVGQVELMQQSRCYQKSSGKLGCISCHDPHERPAPETRIDFYRARCRQCHEIGKNDCSGPKVERDRQQDSCFSCHMGKADSSTIAHTAVTDHRILRKPEANSGATKPMRKLKIGESPVRLFHEGAPGLAPEEAERDLGIGLAQLLIGVPSGNSPLLQLAGPRLEAATSRWPDDVEALEALGDALSAVGKSSEALVIYQKVLAIAPNREAALAQTAETLLKLNRSNQAVEYWKRAIEVNPWNANYHMHLARTHAQLMDWPQARTSCRKSLELNPFDLDTRVLLITACLQSGDRQAAREEFDRLIAIHPKQETELRAWFTKQMQR